MKSHLKATLLLSMKKQMLLQSNYFNLICRRRADREFAWGIPLCEAINDIDITEFLPSYLK